MIQNPYYIFKIFLLTLILTHCCPEVPCCLRLLFCNTAAIENKGRVCLQVKSFALIKNLVSLLSGFNNSPLAIAAAKYFTSMLTFHITNNSRRNTYIENVIIVSFTGTLLNR